MNKQRAYASMCGAKGDVQKRKRFYQIHFTPDPLQITSAWNGPYRDATDAENAAEDEARRRGLELEWVNY